MTQEKFVSRFYRISINVGLYCYASNTRVYKLKSGFTPYLVGFFYALLTLLTGFWGLSIIHKFQGIKNSFESLHHNITGGIDITELEEAEMFDDRTNYLYKNILRSTAEKITKEDVVIIAEIYDHLTEEKGIENVIEIKDSIIKSLKEIDIHRIQETEINDVLEALKLYEKNLNNE